MPDTLRLTRAHVDRLPARCDDRGPIVVEDPPDSFFRDEVERVLSERLDEDLWVFAAGSLIWNPRFEEDGRRAAQIEGWRRAFCYSDQRFRGNPAAPGLMMSLDRGAGCSGVVIRMAAQDLAASLEGLLRKEPPIPTEWVEAETPDGPLRAIAFTASPDFPLYRTEPDENGVVDMLATAVGHVGTMAEYLLNMVTRLEAAGVHDPYLWRLQARLADRLERLG